jgi:hypothetical protein
MFRDLELNDKIDVLEKCISDINQYREFLCHDAIKPLYIYDSEKNAIYHTLTYKLSNVKYTEIKTKDKAYNASILFPKNLTGLTRKFCNNEWSFVKGKEERDICEEYEVIYRAFANRNSIDYNIYGYISVIDSKMRIRKESKNIKSRQDDNIDKRTLTRGLSLYSNEKNELKLIAKKIGIYDDTLHTKERLGREIEDYIIRSGQYSFI